MRGSSPGPAPLTSGEGSRAARAAPWRATRGRWRRRSRQRRPGRVLPFPLGFAQNLIAGSHGAPRGAAGRDERGAGAARGASVTAGPGGGGREGICLEKQRLFVQIQRGQNEPERAAGARAGRAERSPLAPAPGLSYGLLPRPCRALVLLNPLSGPGLALKDFQALVQPMLAEADVAPTVFVTERPHHAHEKVRDEDLSQWDTLVVMSGDGLLHEVSGALGCPPATAGTAPGAERRRKVPEGRTAPRGEPSRAVPRRAEPSRASCLPASLAQVVNGLMERQDWEAAVKTPLCILPGGSGNALAASINHYAGNDHAGKRELLTNCAFILCKGLHTQMDLVSLSTASGTRLFSFLSFGWGFISDVDIASEKYRKLGNARFTLGTLQHLVRLQVYQGRLSYLPADAAPGARDDPPAPVPNGHAGRILPPAETGAPGARAEAALPEDSLLVPLQQPVPAHWTVVPEEEFVFVYAIYQSHLGSDLLMAPAARLHDGRIHLFFLKAGVSRVTMLKLFLAMEKGTHLDLNCPHLRYVPVRAFRLEPRASAGVMTVDGEALACEPVQGQIHGRLCRVLCGS
ncbi:sphingosine kinase 1 isoform X2 [Rhea pennata]|uniref:sphingosine kinase 1 isoform X2 n=1 Tax=Rhea pennata TaxID=8795 RepID=UPI002E260547